MKRTALGFGLSLACVFCVVLISVLGQNDFFRENKLLISLWLAAAGLLAFVAGLGVAAVRGWWARRHNLAVPEVFPLLSLRFWGMMMLVFAALTQLYFILPELRQKAAQSSLLARFRPQKPVAVAAAEPEPALRLQGIIIQPGRRAPTAIINGKAVAVGDMIDGARVVAIHRYGVRIQQGTESQLLEIRDWTQVRVKPATAEAPVRKS